MSYCEIPEFYNESFPKAKKKHPCIECCAPIEIGEKHLYYRGKWDDFDAGRQHMICRELCMDIREHFNNGDCICFGDMKEHYQETSPWPKHTDKDKHSRKLMAQIKWRERKYIERRKLVNGVIMVRKDGAWEAVER